MNKKFLIVEISSAIGILFFFILMGYFFYLNSTLMTYKSIYHNFQKQKTLLTKKEALIKANKEILASLQHWQLKNPIFYKAISTDPTFPKILQTITQAINQSGFLIIQIQPLFDSKKSNITDQLNLKFSGNFQQLFSFITTLNSFEIPLTILSLKINRSEQIDIKLDLTND